jgi:GAF domain-containing protein
VPGGIWSTMVITRQPVVYATAAEAAKGKGARLAGHGESLSSIYLPILGRDRVLGAINLWNDEREHAYGPSAVRLLSTVAASMGVALENARLFDETQRLLKETEQRAAELAVINSIQRGMAEKLDFQQIVDLVGDKLGEVTSTGNVGIRIYDPVTNLISFPYLVENGKRVSIPSRPLPERGFGPHVIRTRTTLVINEDTAAAMEQYGSINHPGTLNERSIAMVPLLSGDRCLGLIHLADYEREHAFRDADIRLVETIASSMGVALENARLFNETQRLLTETEKRSSELAVINSIQRGMAEKLDFRAIVDLVGDKLRELFASDDMGIIWLDREAGLQHPLYVYEHGKRLDLSASRSTRTARSSARSRKGNSSSCGTATRWKPWACPSSRGPTPRSRPCSSRSRSQARSAPPSRSRASSARMPSTRAPRASCRPSPRRWASRFRTRGCSTRRSGS